MFDLFRFVMLRPPEKNGADDTIQINQESDFILQMQEAHDGDSPASKMKELADEFVQGNAFVKDVSLLEHSQKIELFHSEIQQLLTHPDADRSLQTLNGLVGSAFGANASDVISNSTLTSEYRRLYESLVAAKYATTSAEISVVPIQRYLRTIDIVRRISKNDKTLNKKTALNKAMTRSIALPEKLTPLPATEQNPDSSVSNHDNQDVARQDEIMKRVQNLTEAYQFLSRLNPQDFATDAVSESTVRLEGSSNALPARIDNEVLFRELQDIQGMISTDRPSTAGRPLQYAAAFSSGGSKSHLSAQAVQRLSQNGRTTLNDLGINLTGTPVSSALERITAELRSLAPQIMNSPLVPISNVALVGSQFYSNATIQGFQFGALEPINWPALPILPKTHGTVKPVGVGDLLVVKQQLIGYESGEVAYIENILKGESHKREVRRTETIEETTTTEQETIKEEERDLQTTERFEMRRESENVVSLDGRLKGNGNFVSPGYGPVVEFENNNESELNGSQQVSERTASTYGKDVTSRATSKITERVRTQVVRRTVHEFEEKTQHAFENKDGDNVIGVYQWVDKIYEGQTYNYGKRLFYDVVVPEPAAFLVQALAKQQIEGRELSKPDPFTYDAEQITDVNYTYFAQKYGATGIEPPPPQYRTVSKSYAEVDAASQLIARKDDIPFPGYKAIGYHWILRIAYILPHPNPEVVNLLLGTSEATKNDDLHGEVDSISVNILGINVSHIVAAFDIYLERTENTYRIWKSKVHSAITQAYQRRIAEYEERLANVQAAMRIGALGQSAERKRELEKAELKKHCISIFTGQDFSVFNGIESSYQIDPVSGKYIPYPQPNLLAAEIQGKYIRFFEQAFEWEQMIYHFYPYFWSRKNHWMTKAVLEDNDKQFQEFLKSGGARVLLPVRPGFENVLLHFMETGEIWEGGDLPEINSATYVPLIDEIKASQNAPGKEVPYGEPWKFKLPTALVKLRNDEKLPTWKKLNGEWVPNE